MSDDGIKDRVTATIMEVLKVAADEVGDDRRIKEDLGSDSLDAVTLVIALEDVFGGSIDDADAKGLATVGDVVRYIHRRVAEKSLA